MQKVLITGGTGSLGHVLCKKLIAQNIIPIVFSRDEAKHFQLIEKYNIVSVIGDVRDYSKFKSTIKKYKPDSVIHAAALKRIDDMERYPDECIKTNVNGSYNICRASLGEVNRCILVSTDKACANINVYGASKFISERLFTNFDNNDIGTSYCSVRYGNVIASRGSFIPLWLNKIKNKEVINVTDLECTRFLFTLDDAANFVLSSLNCQGGEVFIPLLSSYRIIDVITVLEDLCQEKAKLNITGVRAGEKIHEDMINFDELRYTYKFENKLVILPQISYKNYTYTEKYEGKPVNSQICLNLDRKELKDLIEYGINQVF